MLGLVSQSPRQALAALLVLSVAMIAACSEPRPQPEPERRRTSVSSFETTRGLTLELKAEREAAGWRAAWAVRNSRPYAVVFAPHFELVSVLVLSEGDRVLWDSRSKYEGGSLPFFEGFVVPSGGSLEGSMAIEVPAEARSIVARTTVVEEMRRRNGPPIETSAELTGN